MVQIQKTILSAVLAAGLLPVAARADLPVYLDRSKPIEERVEDALSRMVENDRETVRYTGLCDMLQSAGESHA